MKRQEKLSTKNGGVPGGVKEVRLWRPIISNQVNDVRETFLAPYYTFDYAGTADEQKQSNQSVLENLKAGSLGYSESEFTWWFKNFFRERYELKKLELESRWKEENGLDSVTFEVRISSYDGWQRMPVQILRMGFPENNNITLDVAFDFENMQTNLEGKYTQEKIEALSEMFKEANEYRLMYEVLLRSEPIDDVARIICKKWWDGKTVPSGTTLEDVKNAWNYEKIKKAKKMVLEEKSEGKYESMQGLDLEEWLQAVVDCVFKPETIQIAVEKVTEKVTEKRQEIGAKYPINPQTVSGKKGAEMFEPWRQLQYYAEKKDIRNMLRLAWELYDPEPLDLKETCKNFNNNDYIHMRKHFAKLGWDVDSEWDSVFDIKDVILERDAELVKYKSGDVLDFTKKINTNYLKIAGGKMDPVAAASLKERLKKMPPFQQKRTESNRVYIDALIKAVPEVSESLRFGFEGDDVISRACFHYYMIPEVSEETYQQALLSFDLKEGVFVKYDGAQINMLDKSARFGLRMYRRNPLATAKNHIRLLQTCSLEQLVRVYNYVRGPGMIRNKAWKYQEESAVSKYMDNNFPNKLEYIYKDYDGKNHLEIIKNSLISIIIRDRLGQKVKATLPEHAYMNDQVVRGTIIEISPRTGGCLVFRKTGKSIRTAWVIMETKPKGQPKGQPKLRFFCTPTGVYKLTRYHFQRVNNKYLFDPMNEENSLQPEGGKIKTSEIDKLKMGEAGIFKPISNKLQKEKTDLGKLKKGPAGVRRIQKEKTDLGKQRLNELGLKRVPTRGDGNCLFHAIKIMTGDPRSAQELRDAALSLLNEGENIGYLLELGTLYTAVNPGSVKTVNGIKRVDTFKEYKNEMAQETTYADDVMILALSRVINKGIRVVTSSPGEDGVDGVVQTYSWTDSEDMLTVYNIDQVHFEATVATVAPLAPDLAKRIEKVQIAIQIAEGKKKKKLENKLNKLLSQVPTPEKIKEDQRKEGRQRLLEVTEKLRQGNEPKGKIFKARKIAKKESDRKFRNQKIKAKLEIVGKQITPKQRQEITSDVLTNILAKDAQKKAKEKKKRQRVRNRIGNQVKLRF